MKQFVLSLTLFLGMTLVVFAQSSDITSPVINNVEVTTVDPSTITITWETDELADSLVNYGLKEDYGIVRIPETNRTKHSVTIDDLEAGRLYYFRVLSSDAEGNQGISADYKIQLDGVPQSDGEGPNTAEGQANDDTVSPSTPQISPQTPTEVITEQITELIKQVSDPKELKEILEQVINAVQGVTEDLTIVGPPTVIVETTSAIVKWTTDRLASSEVVFAKSENFNGTDYQLSQSSTGGNTMDHEVRLIGLEPFTEYHFKVKSTDELLITGESKDYTFKTKASLPEIRNLRILKVEENAATIAWDTTTPAKELIEYQDLSTGEQNSKGRPAYSTSHQMRISDLTLGTRYLAFVIAENTGGDRVKSQPLQFITIRDDSPPIISNVTNESTIFPGSESRIQTIVEWRTDEPSRCEMTYREGIAVGADPFTIKNENEGYTEKHVEVIVEFAPATVYQFWLNCVDEAGNSVQSENFVLFTPIQEKNIIDLILENFESTFGWVKSIGK